MTIIDFVLLGAVGLALGLAFSHWNKNRKAGKTCGCDCSRCAGNCHK